MTSTFTNLGVEKPGSGDYSNNWDVPANANYDFLDQAIAGVANVALADANTTLSVPDGTSSDNRKMVLNFTGALTANRDVTFSPSDLTKIVVLKNSMTGGFSLVIKQGSGATPYTLASGKSAIVYLTGSNAVYNALADTSMTSLVVGTLTATSGTVNGSNIVVSTRTVNTSGLLTGGGDLSSDRTIAISSIANNTVVGNVSGGAAVPIALTGTQVTGIIDAASDTVAGKVELATIAEDRTGTDTVRAVTADGLASFWQKGSDIASASTLVKPSDANLGGYHVVTGTTGITAIWSGEPDGTEYEFRFSGVLTLTHNGTSLILPGGVNVTTVAGDVARFRSESSGNWRCVSAPPSWFNLTSSNPYAAKTSGYTVISTDNKGVIDFTTAGVTASLTAAATLGSGFIVTIMNSASSGNVTIDPNSSETLDGQTTRVLEPGNSATIVCTGSAWKSSRAIYTKTSTATAMNTAQVSTAHGFPRKPTRMRGIGICTSTDGTFSSGDVIELGHTYDTNATHVLVSDATNFVINGSTRLQLGTKSGGIGSVELDETKWNVQAIAYDEY